MEHPLASDLTVLVRPFSQCINGVVITTRSFFRSRLVKSHGEAALRAERGNTAAEINLPKCRGRELLMKKGWWFHADFRGVYLLGAQSGFICAVS